MESYDIARFAYLALLLAAVGGSFLVSGKANWGKSLQQLAIWALIFVGAIGGYGLWNDIKGDVMPRQSVMQTGAVEVPRGMDGHFHLTVDLNGTPVDFLVDTGATGVVLSKADAERIGIDPDALNYSSAAQTANGVVRTAPTRVALAELGDARVENLRVFVNEGQLDASLLGMEFLNRFARIEIAGDRMVLHP